MKKRNFIIFYNDQSTRSGEFGERVKKPLNKYCKETGGSATFIHVKSTPEKTIDFIANGKAVKDGDTVLVAGGDGTLGTIVNGLIIGGQKVNLGLLPLGQSNDATGSFVTREVALDVVNHVNAPTIDYRPIELKINGEHFRYALHEWSVGHLANIGAWDDRVQRANKLTGKKTNIPLEIMKYYMKVATKNPSAGLPEYTDKDGVKHNYSVIAAVLGRLGGAWFPRIDGEVVKNLYAGNEFAIENVNVRGNPIIDIPVIVGWSMRGLPARRANSAKFKFTTPIGMIDVMVDGEIFEVTDVRSIETYRIKSNIKLFMP